MAFEFHVSRAARERYEFDEALFESSGNVIIPNFPAARRFASLMNERGDPEREPDRVVRPAELNAMGLIDEILHHAVEIYRRTVNPNVMAGALAAVVAQLQPDRLGRGEPPAAGTARRIGQEPGRTDRGGAGPRPRPVRRPWRSG